MLFLSFYGTLPAGNRDLFATGECQFSGRGVFGDGRACAYGRAFANSDWRNELRIRADECIVPDDSAELVRTIVVAGDGSRSDVDPTAHRAVPYVTQVVRFATWSNLAVLDLYEIANMGMVV